MSAQPRRRLCPAGALCASLFVAAAYGQESEERYVRITAEVADVQVKTDVIGQVRRGEVFKINSEHEQWLLIDVELPAGRQRGWIRRQDVEMMPSSVAATESPSESDPKAPEYIEVVGAEAAVKIGNKTIGTARKGDLFAVLERNGPWLKIEIVVDGAPTRGWISNDQVRPIESTDGTPASSMWPAQSGIVPSVVRTAHLAVDWKSSEVVAEATLPPQVAAAELRIHTPHGAGLDHLQVDRRGLALRVAGTDESLQKCLVPGTRSIWLAAESESATAYHRIDLPQLRLDEAVVITRFETFSEGLVVSVPVEGLLPGFSVHAAWSNENTQTGFAELRSDKGELPRVVDVLRHQEQDLLRLAVPFAANDGSRIQFQIRVQRLDGSMSETLSFTQLGNRLDGDAQIVAKSRSAPIDAAVTVPAIEFMNVTNAVSKLQECGLIAEFVDAGSLRPMAAVSQPDRAIVTTQGLAPDSVALAGESLIVGIVANSSEAIPVYDLIEADHTLIDIGDSYGLIELDDGRSRVWSSFSPARSSTENPSGLTPRLAAPDSQNREELGDVTSVSIRPRPLFPLDARSHSQPPEVKFLARVAKLAELAVLARPTPRGLPGAIGHATTESIELHEDVLEEAMYSNDAAAIRQVFDNISKTVTRNLHVDLAETATRAMHGDWSAAFRHHISRGALDCNRNGPATDDIVFWQLAWMFQHGHYSPAAYLQLEAMATGDPQLHFHTTPQSTAWIDAVMSTTSGSALGGLTPTSLPAAAQAPVVPSREPSITLAMGPTEVRVPGLLESTVRVASERLGALGLRIDDVQNLFETDLVVDSRPEASAWVDPTSSVELTVTRKVPPITNKKLADAQTVLRRWRLQPAWTGNSFADDIVFEQLPAAGTYVAPEEPVHLELRVVIPHVEGQPQSQAVAALKEKDLKWSAPTRAFKTDKVVNQDPKASSLARHGDTVTLKLQLKVPKVDDGRSLSSARDLLNQWDVVPDVSNELARAADLVRGQRPAAGTYVDHGSRVVLDPVNARVPPVRGQTIEAATRRLDDEDFEVARIGDLLGADVVTSTEPTVGAELARGGTVSLDARVPVPRITRGMSVVQARNLIDGSPNDLRWAVVDDWWDHDVVYSLSHRPGVLVYPRTTIEITPGVNVPNVEGSVVGRAEEMLGAADLEWHWDVVGTQETTEDGLIGEDIVRGQSVRPGIHPRRNIARINLQVVRYVEATRTVPQVANFERPLSEAIRMIQSADLTPAIILDGRRMSAAEYLASAIGQTIRQGARGQALREPAAERQNPPGGTQVRARSIVLIEGTTPRPRTDVDADPQNPFRRNQ